VVWLRLVSGPVVARRWSKGCWAVVQEWLGGGLRGLSGSLRWLDGCPGWLVDGSTVA
jgi:hypothetical protein